MDQNFLQEVEGILYQMKKEIISNLVSENENLDGLLKNHGPKDDVDVAAADIDSNLLDAISKKELIKLEQIDKAIARINFGTFGLCTRCGKQISKERILALPYSTVCMDCKLELEKNKR